jgi:hypothetical protein
MADESGRLTPLREGSFHEKNSLPPDTCVSPKLEACMDKAEGPNPDIESNLITLGSHPMVPCMDIKFLKLLRLTGTST